MNQKNKFQKNTVCRYCKNSPETQKHIIKECKEPPWVNEKIIYKNIFQNEDVNALKTMANRIIQIVESIETHNEDQSAWAPHDEPPGYLGECNTTTTTVLWCFNEQDWLYFSPTPSINRHPHTHHPSIFK